MTQLYMLDTNMVSYIVNGRSQAARMRLTGLAKGEIACISAISEAELLFGAAKSGIGEQRQRVLDWFIARLKVYPWGRDESAVYGALRARQEALGRSLGPFDMQIAAHAIAVQAVLITNDKAFRHVKGLHGMQNWATDL